MLLEGQELKQVRYGNFVFKAGTAFMDKLSKNFKLLIEQKIKKNPLWQNKNIIYSGPESFGEGEH